MDCVFYAQGRCNKGLHCPYRHPNPGVTEVCEAWFAEGGCLEGNLCAKLHPSKRKAREREVGARSIAAPCKFHAMRVCNKGANCSFSHENAVNEESDEEEFYVNEEEQEGEAASSEELSQKATAILAKHSAVASAEAAAVSYSTRAATSTSRQG
jgi:hypothetical protein